MNAALKKLFEDYFKEYMELIPIMATFIGIHKYNHLYPNYLSEQEIVKNKIFYKKYLNLIKKINKLDLSKKDIHHINVLKSRLEGDLESYKYPFDLLPIDHFNNFIIDHIETSSPRSWPHASWCRIYRS